MVLVFNGSTERCINKLSEQDNVYTDSEIYESKLVQSS